MAIVNKNNISLGLGNLELGTYTDDVFDSYTDVGAIKTELTVAHTREVLDFESGRPLVTILQEVIRERVIVTATLAELTVATMKMALGQAALSTGIPTFQGLTTSKAALSGTLATGLTTVLSGSILKFGGIPTHAYVGLRFTHVKANGKRHIFEGYKASPSGELTLPFRETDWNLYQVVFRLLADTTKTAGEQYYQLHIES